MRIVKSVAFVCIGLGLFVFGGLSALVGGLWGTVTLIWLGAWIAVGVLAQLADPYDF